VQHLYETEEDPLPEMKKALDELTAKKEGASIQATKDLNSKIVWLLRNRATAHSNVEDFAAAVADFTTASEVDPKVKHIHKCMHINNNLLPSLLPSSTHAHTHTTER
jgi:hypothetical protein